MSNNVAVLLGPSSKDVVEKIKNKNDNYRFSVFEDLSAALEASVTHEILFKRILVYEKCLASATGLVQDEDDPRVQALEALDRYIDDGRQDTEVVLVCNTTSPTNIHKYFIDVLDNPNVTPVLPQKLTVPLATEFVSGSIMELQSKYYELDKKGIQIKIASQEEDTPKTKKPANSKKKGGLFGMFGKSKEEPEKKQETRSASSDFSDTARAQDSAQRLAQDQGLGAGSYDMAMSQEYRGIGGDDDSGQFDGPAGDLGLGGDDNLDSGGFDDSESDEDWSDSSGGLEGLMSFASDGSDHTQTGFLDEDDDDDEYDDQGSWEDSEATGFVDEESTGFADEDYGSEDVGWNQEGSGWSGDDTTDSSGEQYDSEEYAPSYDVSAPEEFGHYDPAPTQAIPRVELERSWDESSQEQYSPTYDDPEEEIDRRPKVLDRIVVVTGDRGSGVTTEAATLAYGAAEEGKYKVLLIDLDFEKAGVVGMLDDMAEFIKGDHSISSRNPYKEGPLDVLSNGYDGNHSPEDVQWVVDSRNYAEYTKIVIDCPIENLNLIEDLLKHTGIVVMMTGTPVGIVNTVRKLNDWFLVSDEVAKIMDKRGHFYPIRESDDFEEVLEKLKSTFVFDRVNWLSKVG